MEEHAPQSVRDCPSLTLLRQVWNQHFERVDGQVRGRNSPTVESAQRVMRAL